MSNSVLITGASGLVGTALTEVLLKNHYQVSHLGRSRTSKKSVKSYIWDIKRGFIEEGAIESANIVVHLAGAGVADKPWTESRKQEIMQSRVQSTRLLFEKLASIEHQCEAVVAASAIGIYGMNTGADWVDEESTAGTGFLVDVVRQWEQEITRFEQLNLRVVTLRTGVVLSDEGGALPKIAKPIKMNVGAAIGTGDQYMSWIHIDDLCGIILSAIRDGHYQGVFNAVAPNPVTNKQFTKILAQVLNKALWLPPVPGMVLKMALGELAQVVLGGNRVSAKKIVAQGYHFEYGELTPALQAIYD